MYRVGVFVRVLMLLTCLVPFTSPRQASAAFTPTPTAPSDAAEEDDTDREETEQAETADGAAKARTSPHRLDRQPLAFVRIAFPTYTAPIHLTPAAAPAPADPFHNGLGSPYRC